MTDGTSTAIYKCLIVYGVATHISFESVSRGNEYFRNRKTYSSPLTGLFLDFTQHAKQRWLHAMAVQRMLPKINGMEKVTLRQLNGFHVGEEGTKLGEFACSDWYSNQMSHTHSYRLTLIELRPGIDQ